MRNVRLWNNSPKTAESGGFFQSTVSKCVRKAAKFRTGRWRTILDKSFGDPSFSGLGANARYLTMAPESCLTASGQVRPQADRRLCAPSSPFP
jgi:hypothetical protein